MKQLHEKPNKESDSGICYFTVIHPLTTMNWCNNGVKAISKLKKIWLNDSYNMNCASYATTHI